MTELDSPKTLNLVLSRAVRASVAVECMNSVLRMHQARHRTLAQGMLDLKRLYWNTRQFREGKRKGRCPYQLLGLSLPHSDFWSLLQAELNRVQATDEPLPAERAQAA
jgi:hypothetical protein